MIVAATPDTVTLDTPPMFEPVMVSEAPPTVLTVRVENPLIIGALETIGAAIGVVEALAELADDVPVAFVAVDENV